MCQVLCIKALFLQILNQKRSWRIPLKTHKPWVSSTDKSHIRMPYKYTKLQSTNGLFAMTSMSSTNWHLCIIVALYAIRAVFKITPVQPMAVWFWGGQVAPPPWVVNHGFMGFGGTHNTQVISITTPPTLNSQSYCFIHYPKIRKHLRVDSSKNDGSKWPDSKKILLNRA